MTTFGETRTLGVGQTQWYSFPYPGRDSNNNQPTAIVELMAMPGNSAGFEVWTANGLTAQANGDTNLGVPLGRGTLHPFGNDSQPRLLRG